MDPISVSVRRGEFVESQHTVYAVAVQDGAVVAEAGDRALVTSLRSSAKPFQALQLVRARADLTDADVAGADLRATILKAIRGRDRIRGLDRALNVEQAISKD